MRKLTLLLAIAAIVAIAALATPACATHRVTVEQLHAWLATHRPPAHSDNEIARQIYSFALSEWLTPPTLAAFKSELNLGPKAGQALDLLADCSAILDPPPAELPSRPPPDAAALKAMFHSTVYFVGTTLHQMPDFLATRVTESYDDNDPRTVSAMPDTTEDVSTIAPHSTMVPLGTFAQQITYRDGKEVPSEEKNAKEKHSQSGPSFSTRGEFGPLLATILLDASKGKLSWSHWEQTGSGVVAVFRYQVPQTISRYAVEYCCLGAGQDRVSGATFIEASPGQPARFVANDAIPGTGKINDSYRGTPSYHGKIYIDPATGAILRITRDAELNPSEPITRDSSVIDYGEVEIGGRRFICPLRSVAIRLTRAYLPGQPGIRTILQINRTKFENYHRFGSSAEIVSTEELH